MIRYPQRSALVSGLFRGGCVMKRKFYLLASLLLALGLLSLMVGCDRKEQSMNAPTSVQVDQPDSSVPDGQADKATDAQKAWWRGLSQAARNQAILERAYRDNNVRVGLNCKDWARTVVLDASKTVVNLPGTLPDAYGWYFGASPYLRTLSGIRAVFPGCVVQTNWKLADGSITPHTFIVAATSTSGMYIIESNWCKPPCYTVYIRYITFDSFESQVFRYNCYYVVGG